MAVKAVLASLEGIPEPLQAEYELGADKRYYLKLEAMEGHPVDGPLVRAKDHEKTARQKAEAEAKEAREKLEALAIEKEELLKGLVPKDNITALEKSWADRSAKREAELNERITVLDKGLRQARVMDVAQTIAAKVAKSAVEAPVLLPFITARLSVELVDGEARTRVLDVEGKPSAATIDDLQKEIVANPMFASIIIGSKATGSGAQGSQSGGGAPKMPGPDSSPQEWAAWAKAKREARNSGG